MFLGALLLCASVTDVSSCDVKMNMKDFYDTKEECALETDTVIGFISPAFMIVVKRVEQTVNGMIVDM